MQNRAGSACETESIPFNGILSARAIETIKPDPENLPLSRFEELCSRAGRFWLERYC